MREFLLRRQRIVDMCVGRIGVRLTLRIVDRLPRGAGPNVHQERIAEQSRTYVALGNLACVAGIIWVFPWFRTAENVVR